MSSEEEESDEEDLLAPSRLPPISPSPPLPRSRHEEELDEAEREMIEVKGGQSSQLHLLHQRKRKRPDEELDSSDESSVPLREEKCWYSASEEDGSEDDPEGKKNGKDNGKRRGKQTWTYHTADCDDAQTEDFSKLTGNEAASDVIRRIDVVLASVKDQHRSLTLTESKFLMDCWTTHRYALVVERTIGLGTTVGDYGDIVFLAVATKSVTARVSIGDLWNRVEAFCDSLPQEESFGMPEPGRCVKMSWFQNLIWVLPATWDAVTCESLEKYVQSVGCCIAVATAAVRGEVFVEQEQLDVPRWATHCISTGKPRVTMNYVRAVEPWLAGAYNSLRYINAVFGSSMSGGRYLSVLAFRPDPGVRKAAAAWAKKGYQTMDYDNKMKDFMEIFIENDSHPGECFHYNKTKREKPIEPREAVEIERSELFLQTLTMQSHEEALFGEEKLEEIPGALLRKGKDMVAFLGAISALERDCQLPLRKHFVSYSRYECNAAKALDGLLYPAIASVGRFYLLVEGTNGDKEPICRADDMLEAVCAFVDYQAHVKKNRLAAVLYKQWEKSK